MKVSSFLVCGAVVISAGLVSADHHETSGHLLAQALYGHHEPKGLVKAVTFHDDMRKLWEDHIVWTRGFIVSVAHDLPDAGVTAGRLLENQTHIGDALKPFYGTAKGNELTALLREHILIAAEILTAAKAGDDTAAGEAIGRWYVNGDEIADFLSALNRRNWPQEDLRMMMAEHLDTTLTEAVSRLTGDYAQDIADYEVVHHHILMMADLLSNGIIKQFPRKFR
jgi:hypothetical protein